MNITNAASIRFFLDLGSEVSAEASAESEVGLLRRNMAMAKCLG
ncbi:hypothetical protein [Rhodopirellula bahusiensis]|nr:hypothetical protein [Rhodopirellula bahusiensis]